MVPWISIKIVNNLKQIKNNLSQLNLVTEDGKSSCNITVVRRPNAHGCLIGIFKSLGGGLLHEH